METHQNPDREGGEHTHNTYLITWACYGAWLPGHEGAISRTRNRFGAPLLEPNTNQERHSRARTEQDPYRLDDVRRTIVLDAVIEVCRFRGWRLLACHVRTNHVHVIVTADRAPEPVMIAMKAYCSRALNDHSLDAAHRRRWARHGSTRYLWNRDSVTEAIKYVVYEQGAAMALYQDFGHR